MDFTLKTYRQLLQALLNRGFVFQTFQEFLENNQGMRAGVPPLGGKGVSAGKDKQKTIILRHDVDKLPQNALRFAQIQHELGIKGSYYFRAVPGSWDEEIIKKIAALGHEIGYHYEDVDLAAKLLKWQLKSDSKKEAQKLIAEKAIKLFEKHLAELRKHYPVKTICMHGSPLSKYDNKILWEYYDYKHFGIFGEPYFDVDFSKVLYLTDTGRRWNGEKVSIRDKVNKRADIPLGTKGERQQVQGFKRTSEIIQAVNKGALPDQIMFTFHPQRWTDNSYLWLKEFVVQNVKNQVKKAIIRFS